MQILKIELDNIRSYVHEEIRFGKGLNFIQGDIGAGKSTILMAVKFAIFGKSKGLDYTQLLREGAKEGSVKLTLLVKGKEYTITRRLRRKVVRKKGEVVEGIEQEKVVIEDEDTRQELSPTEADERIMKLIESRGRLKKQGFSRMYEFALYVPQEQMKEIFADLKQDRETKKKTISQLLGCEIYRIARENANEIREILKDEIELKMAKLGENYIEIEKREQALEVERGNIREMEKEVKGLEREIEDLNKEFNEVSERRKNLEKLREEKDDLEKKISGGSAKQKQIKEEIGRLGVKIDNTKKEIEDGKERLETLRQSHDLYLQISKIVDEGKAKKEKVVKIELQIKERGAKVEALKEQIAKLEKEVSRLADLEKKVESYGDVERELEKLELEKDENTEKMATLRTEIGKLKAEIEEAEKEKENFTGLESLQICPKCRQPLTKEHIERIVKEIEEKQREKNELIKEKEMYLKRINARQIFIETQIKDKRKIQKEKEKILHMLEEIEKKRKDLEKGKRMIEGLEVEIEKLRNDVKTIGFNPEEFAENEEKLKELSKDEEEWNRLMSVIEEKEKQLGKYIQEMKERKQELQELEQKLAELKQKLREIPYDEQEYKRTLEEYNEIYGNLRANKAKVAEINKRIEEKKESISEIQEELDALKDDKKRVEVLKAHVDFFEKLAECYEEIEKNVLREERYRLEAELRSFFNELIENSEMDITLDEDFTPEINVGEGYIRPFENLSGGEGTALSLAYRLALNNVITKNFFGENALLILDEPTDGFSSEQINLLRELLGRIKESYGNGQIFVVSHEQELEGAADVVYDVTQTGNGTKVKMRGINGDN